MTDNYEYTQQHMYTHSTLLLAIKLCADIFVLTMTPTQIRTIYK